MTATKTTTQYLVQVDGATVSQWARKEGALKEFALVVKQVEDTVLVQVVTSGGKVIETREARVAEPVKAPEVPVAEPTPAKAPRVKMSLKDRPRANAAVRAWAVEQGHELSPTGHVRKASIDAYLAVHPEAQVTDDGRILSPTTPKAPVKAATPKVEVKPEPKVEAPRVVRQAAEPANPTKVINVADVLAKKPEPKAVRRARAARVDA